MERYRINQNLFNKNYINKNSYKHNTSNVFKLFPFTTKDKGLKDFSNIIGPFIRAIFDFEKSSDVLFENIIEKVCEEIDIEGDLKQSFIGIVKDIYFNGDGKLKCSKLGTFQYSENTKNEIKIADYLVSVLCDKERIKNALMKKIDNSSNALDMVIERNLPELAKKEDDSIVEYYNLNPKIKSIFTNDMVYLINGNIFDMDEIVNLLSYYYFFYTSQTILKINDFFETKKEIYEVYFCLNWEKTSQNRPCYKFGWNQIDRKLETMFSHAILLDMLNNFFIENEKTELYDYLGLANLYHEFNESKRIEMFEEIKQLRKKYRTYISDFNFDNIDNVEYGDVNSLIRAFYHDIFSQFMGSGRKSANHAYQSGFREFTKNNFLQSRGKSGLMLSLSEEQIVLFTKVIIKNKDKMQLKILFKEFENRGIFLDNITKECLVEFYDKLGLIEKKSDSGDAKYVKGIL